MSSILAVPEAVSSKPAQSRRGPLLLVLTCTLIGAAAQILIKTGANGLAAPSAMAMLQNLPLVAGYSLYGVSTVLLILALRRGELSILYPVIALTYVWVTLLSVALFHESMNPLKAIGLASIVTGVALLGRGRRL